MLKLFFITLKILKNMKFNTKFLLFLLLICGLWINYGCQSRNRDYNYVSVSILPEKYFIDRLTDEKIDVNVMIPSGANHETYSPTPQQFKKLSDSRLYICIGYLGYEQAWIERLEELNPQMQILNLSHETELICSENVQHGDHVHLGGIDPHIWMSPKVMLELAPKIKETLIENFPEHKETIEANYPVLLEELEIKHKEMETVSNNVSKKKFMIFHPALTYLARDYGFEQIPLEFEGKEPTPARLAAIIKTAVDEKINLIFIQEEYDIRNAEQIAKETGAIMVTINPLAYNWIEAMNEIIESLQTYLK